MWDCKAAAKIRAPTAGMLTGGFGTAELTEAGAVAVYENLPELRAHLDELPTATPSRGWFRFHAGTWRGRVRCTDW